MRQGQVDYISGFSQDGNKNSQNSKQRVTRLGELIENTDLFRVGKVGGKGLMILLNIGLLAGVLCAIGGAILTVIPGQSEEDIIKTQLLNVNSKWKYDNKQSILSKFNVQADLLEQSNPLSDMKQKKNSNSNESKKNSSKETYVYYNPIVNRSSMSLKDILPAQQISTTIPTGVYQSPFVTLQNAHFSSIIDFNAEPIILENKHCLQIQVTNNDNINKSLHIEGMPTCGSYKNSIPVNLIENKMLSFSEMIKMNLCSNDDSCEKVCDENDGVAHAIVNKNKNPHSLNKSFEISKQTCTASFAVKELCLVFSLDSKTQSINKYVGGCYNGNTTIYDFQSNVAQTQVTLREKEDPYLAALNYSSDYSPYIVTQTQKEKNALTLYCFGVGLFAFLIVCLVVLRIKEEREEKFTKVSRVSQIQPEIEVTNY